MTPEAIPGSGHQDGVARGVCGRVPALAAGKGVRGRAGGPKAQAPGLAATLLGLLLKSDKKGLTVVWLLRQGRAGEREARSGALLSRQGERGGEEAGKPVTRRFPGTFENLISGRSVVSTTKLRPGRDGSL